MRAVFIASAPSLAACNGVNTGQSLKHPSPPEATIGLGFDSLSGMTRGACIVKQSTETRPGTKRLSERVFHARSKEQLLHEIGFAGGASFGLSSFGINLGFDTLDRDAQTASTSFAVVQIRACDVVLRSAHDQGLLTDARLWTRIDRAADAGQAGTIASLAGWLGEPGRRSAQQLALALRDPAAALAAAAGWPDQPRQREAAALALARLARRQVDGADTAWQQLRSHFAFSEAQRNQILRTLALFHATDFDDGALARLIALPAAAQSEATREWRVRVALARQDWNAVLAAVDAMPADQQQDGEWRYFRARALAALNRGDEARRLFEAQAGQATFFGFL